MDFVLCDPQASISILVVAFGCRAITRCIALRKAQSRFGGCRELHFWCSAYGNGSSFEFALLALLLFFALLPFFALGFEFLGDGFAGKCERRSGQSFCRGFGNEWCLDDR